MNAADMIRNQEKEEVKITIPKGKVLLKMRSGGSWTTGDGVHFSTTHPFQLVSEYEADILTRMSRFREAGKDELLAYYKK